MNKLFPIGLIVLSTSFMACQQSNLEHPNQALGIVEISFDAQGKSGVAKWVSTPQTRTLLGNQNNVSFAASNFTVSTSGTNKFLTAKFNVSNTGSSALQDLTLVAYHQASNQADTAIKGLVDFSGGVIGLDSYAQSAKPIHGMNGTTVNDAAADLQVFSETETSSLQTEASSLLQAGEYLFPYGFEARASSTSRLIPVGSNTGTLTVGVKVPDSNEPSTSVERFKMTFIVFTSPVTARVTQSLEEQGTNNVNTRKTDLGATDVLALGGSSLLTNSSVLKACSVRTAGSSSSPLAYLVNSSLFNLTTIAPAANLNTATASTNLDLTYDTNVNAPSSSDWIVRGGLTGIKAGVIAGTGTTGLSFNPSTDFKAGELVTVTLNAGAVTESAGGLKSCVGDGKSWQFRTGVSGGTGMFGPKTDYATGKNPYYVTLGDVNNDQKLDLITANNAAATASVLLGNGDGTFNAKTEYTTGALPRSVTLGDVNNDQKLDFILVNYTNSTASVFLNP